MKDADVIFLWGLISILSLIIGALYIRNSSRPNPKDDHDTLNSIRKEWVFCCISAGVPFICFLLV